MQQRLRRDDQGSEKSRSLAGLEAPIIATRTAPKSLHSTKSNLFNNA
jgi:hypothetical protein